MALNNVQVTDQVRELVTLLMTRPITEEIALRVGTHDGFKHLEIVNGDWTGFERDSTLSGEARGWLTSKLLILSGKFCHA